MAELSQFHIRVLLVEPGAFRTEGIYGQTYFDLNPIEDYDSVRRSAMTRFASIPGREPGDPDKAVCETCKVDRLEKWAQERMNIEYRRCTISTTVQDKRAIRNTAICP